jgi:hypothetical protein
MEGGRELAGTADGNPDNSARGRAFRYVWPVWLIWHAPMGIVMKGGRAAADPGGGSPQQRSGSGASRYSDQSG